MTQTKTCLVFQLNREVKSVLNQLWMLTSKMERHTSVKVKLYVRVFLLFGRIVVGPAFHSANTISKGIVMCSQTRVTYTWTLRTSMLARGCCGMKSTESAVNSAVQNATVVKNPNTFCALTKVECILLVECRDGLKSNTLQSARAGVISVLY